VRGGGDQCSRSLLHSLIRSPAQPLLNPYELEVALGRSEWLDVYPMDYYSDDGGVWSNGAQKAVRAVSSGGDKTASTCEKLILSDSTTG